MEADKKSQSESKSKEQAAEDVEMQEEKEETDTFALLHDNFESKTKPALLKERASIFELIDSISSELNTNKSKILER